MMEEIWPGSAEFTDKIIGDYWITCWNCHQQIHLLPVLHPNSIYHIYSDRSLLFIPPYPPSCRSRGLGCDLEIRVYADPLPG